MKKLTLLLFCLLLAACVSAGVEVTQNQVASLQKGVTTYSDVVARFGKPTSVMLRSDGSKIVSYVYVHSQARPQSFIPIIGPFVGGADAKSNAATLVFDNNGILTDYYASETNVGAGTGAAGGTYREQTDQPREATQP
jgi:outer membrane protein assembly factor BamE (lipoprotein component of BamABCDE complex)